jgi:hypothetical protein
MCHSASQGKCRHRRATTDISSFPDLSRVTLHVQIAAAVTSNAVICIDADMENAGFQPQSRTFGDGMAIAFL